MRLTLGITLPSGSAEGRYSHFFRLLFSPAGDIFHHTEERPQDRGRVAVPPDHPQLDFRRQSLNILVDNPCSLEILQRGGNQRYPYAAGHEADGGLHEPSLLYHLGLETGLPQCSTILSRRPAPWYLGVRTKGSSASALNGTRGSFDKGCVSGRAATKVSRETGRESKEASWKGRYRKPTSTRPSARALSNRSGSTSRSSSSTLGNRSPNARKTGGRTRLAAEGTNPTVSRPTSP